MGIVYFLLGLFFSLAMTPIFIKIALNFSIVDIPDGNLKKHNKITPYLGGFVFYLSFCLAYFISYSNIYNIYLFLGLTFLAILGLIDDLMSLSPLCKFAGQAIAAFFLILALDLSIAINFYNILSILVKYFFILTIINAFNLIDIMDGLATSIAIKSTILLFIISNYYINNGSLSYVLLFFLGSLFGFLYYNLPQAKIYLGDLGSMFIGGFLSFLSLKITANLNNTFLKLLIISVAFAIPILELLSLIIIRSYNNIPFYQGSPHHFAIYLKNKSWPIKYILIYIAIFILVINAVLVLFLFKLISLKLLIFLYLIMLVLWHFNIYGSYRLSDFYLKK